MANTPEQIRTNPHATIDQALARLQKLAGTGTTYGARVNAEQEYAQAYDREVRQGTKPALRAKYRQ